MAVTAKLYASAIGQAFQGNHKWLTSSGDTYKVALLSVSDITNINTHTAYTDLANEITGTGYTTGGATITTTTATVTAANSWGTAWAATTAYAQGAVVRPSTGNGFLYYAEAGGTSGGSAPTWPTVVGATVVDNTVTWTCIGESITQLTGGNASWTTATLSANCAVVYDSTSGKLLSVVDFGSTVSSTAATYTVTAPTLGWAWFTPA